TGDELRVILEHYVAALNAVPESEPDAWMYENIQDSSKIFGDSPFQYGSDWAETPLYTHPSPSDQSKLVEELEMIKRLASSRGKTTEAKDHALQGIWEVASRILARARQGGLE